MKKAKKKNKNTKKYKNFHEVAKSNAERIQEIITTFFRLIAQLCDDKDSYVKRPGKDFSRNRSISLNELILFMLQLRCGNMPGELANYFDISGETPTAPACIQQRSKLKLQLFIDLFNGTVKNLLDLVPPELYEGYELLAYDGSDTPCPRAVDCTKQGIVPIKGKSVVNGAHTIFGINGEFNISRRMYTNVTIEEGDTDERARAAEMIKSSLLEHVIALFDRGYECWELMAQCLLKEWQFVIRAKDVTSNGICKGLNLPTTSEFDQTINMTIVNRQTNEIKMAIEQDPNSLHYVSWEQFSMFPQHPRLNGDKSLHEFKINFRIVRIEVEPGKYEVLFTSLPRDKFPPEKLKELYWMRWGIEIGFRQVKYTNDLVRIHSVKTEYVMQELYCRFVSFNLASALTKVSEIPEPTKERKYAQQIKFTAAVRCVREVLKNTCKDLLEIAEYLIRNLAPIKPGRAFERNKSPRSSQPFNSRSAG